LPKPLPRGACQVCGEQGLVEWARVRRRDLADIDYTIQVLKKECIRHHQWCVVEIDEIAVERARRKGCTKMREHAEKVIRKSVGGARNFREGWQTPWEGDVVFYAQHATATCCRKCIEYWHGVEFGRDLTEEEVRYMAALVMRYIEEKLQLTEEGEKIPYRRKKQSTLTSVQKQNE
jgi:hypothetical protein